MNMFKDYWIRFGCFLIGYNYDLIKDSSEISKKFVKKMTSALLIISMIWSFIGFSFGNRYLQLSLGGSIISGLIMLIVIIQIERQILLSIKINKLAFLIRLLLGIIVAIIGATIIDQIFFKNDIEIQKRDLISERVSKRTTFEKTAKSTADNYFNTEIHKKDSVIKDLSKAIALEGNYILSGRTDVQTIDSNNTQTKKSGATYKLNPKIAERDTLYTARGVLVNQLMQNQKDYFAKIDKIKNDALNEKVGFLDELNLMVSLVSNSGIALFVYSLWFLFFVFIEIFIVITKWSNESNDYDKVILFQELIREQRLNALEERSSRYIGNNSKQDRATEIIKRRI